jgi:hypothetical protein
MHLALLLVLASSPTDWAQYQASPTDPKAAYRLAVQLIAERKYGEATAVLNEVAAKEPRWAEIFSARCSAQLGLKRPDSAAADCRYALQVKPELVVALYGLATAERALGQDAQAAAHFRQYAGSTNPDATLELKAAARKAADELEGTLQPPPPPPPAPVAQQPTAEQWIAMGSATHDAHEAVRRPATPGVVRNVCSSNLDCGRGWCKDRGDGVHVCMDRGGQGDFCSSNLDCGRGWCKDRGDGVHVCMDRGGQGESCQSNLDCGRGWCKDRGDGMKVCMDHGGQGQFCESGLDCGGGLWCKDRGDGLKACMR